MFRVSIHRHACSLSHVNKIALSQPILKFHGKLLILILTWGLLMTWEYISLRWTWGWKVRSWRWGPDRRKCHHYIFQQDNRHYWSWRQFSYIRESAKSVAEIWVFTVEHEVIQQTKFFSTHWPHWLTIFFNLLTRSSKLSGLSLKVILRI